MRCLIDSNILLDIRVSHAKIPMTWTSALHCSAGMPYQVEPRFVADGRLSCSISIRSMGGDLACCTSRNILTAKPTIARPISATTAFMRLSQNLQAQEILTPQC